jgi:hypothetical protein
MSTEAESKNFGSINRICVKEVMSFISETFLPAGEAGTEEYHTVIRHKNSIKDSLLHIPFDSIDTVLSLALSAYSSLRVSTQTLSYQEAIQKEMEKMQKSAEREKGDVEREWREKLAVMEGRLARVKGELEAAEIRASGYRRSLEESGGIFSGALEQVSKEKAEQYKKEIDRLTDLFGRQISSAEERGRAMEERLRMAHKEEIDLLRRQLEKSFVSSEKGRVGEEDFDCLARQYTSWPSLENTSKIEHCCDRLGRLYGYKVLFELKNYSDEVKTKEVEKFLRDMDEHPDAVMGVFFSYKTGIVGKKAGGFLFLEWSAKNQLLLYVNRALEHDPADIFKVIDMLIPVAGRMAKMCEEGSGENSEALVLKEKIMRAKVVLEKEIAHMSEFKRILNSDLKRLEMMLAEIHQKNIMMVEHSLTNTRLVLDCLFGADCVKEVVTLTTESSGKAPLEAFIASLPSNTSLEQTPTDANASKKKSRTKKSVINLDS